MKHLSINITGKVHGVYYRASTKQKADELNLKGTVKNLSNGSVQIEVVGAEQVLQKFIAWCQEGPERAEVQAVNYVESEMKNDYLGFEIVR